ncbi:hypothetical protein PsorP6_005534 [Peronosclerospora sorghi]|uniref:Uncharacterized protein n=1 Tax=Peronosclerospora sorghi TaxID=230839 RepID=A0ACC0W5E7_9STRA|nr:hypothetical protein PsorP6_005534 [Peronosclerospora sorghi]
MPLTAVTPSLLQVASKSAQPVAEERLHFEARSMDLSQSLTNNVALPASELSYGNVGNVPAGPLAADVPVAGGLLAADVPDASESVAAESVAANAPVTFNVPTNNDGWTPDHLPKGPLFNPRRSRPCAFEVRVRQRFHSWESAHPKLSKAFPTKIWRNSVCGGT